MKNRAAFVRRLSSAVLCCVLAAGPTGAQQADEFSKLRHALAGAIEQAMNLVRKETGGQPIDRRVIEAIGKVPRHEFAPPELRPYAYLDRPLTVGPGPDSTISQPSLVAMMTDLLEIRRGQRVLEVGVGGGYQTAILAELTPDVHSVEYDPKVAAAARATLKRLGYGGAKVNVADGYFGWRPDGPYDAILVRMAIPDVTNALLDQLKPGGRLVAPIGPTDEVQILALLRKNADGQISMSAIMPVRFRPLPGGTRL